MSVGVIVVIGEVEDVMMLSEKLCRIINFLNFRGASEGVHFASVASTGDPFFTECIAKTQKWQVSYSDVTTTSPALLDNSDRQKLLNHVFNRWLAFDFNYFRN